MPGNLLFFMKHPGEPLQGAWILFVSIAALVILGYLILRCTDE